MSLEEVKEGDVLLVPYRYGPGADCVAVARLTAIHVVTRDGRRFMKRSGKLVGSGLGFSATWARLASADEIAAANQARRIKAAKDELSRVPVTAANLAAVEALLLSLRQSN